MALVTVGSWDLEQKLPLLSALLNGLRACSHGEQMKQQILRHNLWFLQQILLLFVAEFSVVLHAKPHHSVGIICMLSTWFGFHVACNLLFFCKFTSDKIHTIWPMPWISIRNNVSGFTAGIQVDFGTNMYRFCTKRPKRKKTFVSHSNKTLSSFLNWPRYPSFFTAGNHPTHRHTLY